MLLRGRRSTGRIGGAVTDASAWAALVAHTAQTAPVLVVHQYSNFEEVGHGAASGVPSDVAELVAVDMGAIGEGLQGDERAVSICAKDSGGPYDLALRRHLVTLAKRYEIPYRLDVYPDYGSDAEAALRAGGDYRIGLFGPGVDASHSFERTHRDGLAASTRLLLAYLLDG